MPLLSPFACPALCASFVGGAVPASALLSPVPMVTNYYLLAWPSTWLEWALTLVGLLVPFVCLVLLPALERWARFKAELRREEVEAWLAFCMRTARDGVELWKSMREDGSAGADPTPP